MNDRNGLYAQASTRGGIRDLSAEGKSIADMVSIVSDDHGVDPAVNREDVGAILEKRKAMGPVTEVGSKQPHPIGDPNQTRSLVRVLLLFSDPTANTDKKTVRLLTFRSTYATIVVSYEVGKGERHGTEQSHDPDQEGRAGI